MNRYKGFAAVLSTLLAVTVMLPADAYADDAEEKTVRVGYVNALNYEEGGEGEYKKGAGYEYLQKISYLTGWDYEYVYGSFSECCAMLADGEIDLFGNVSYTPERAELFDFSSYPQGKDTYWLYADKSRTELAGGNLNRLDGCKIGVTDGSYQEGLLKEWLQSNSIDADVVAYSGYDEMMPALDAGDVDAIAAPDLATSYDYQAIVSIGFSDFYFAVSKQRPDILEELNSALYEIQTSEADYNSKLSSRYYYKSASGLPFNDEEKNWLAAHGNTLRIGYLTDNLPFSGEEEGELNGILKTVADTLESEYGITVEEKPYSSLDEMKQAIEEEKKAADKAAKEQEEIQKEADKKQKEAEDKKKEETKKAWEAAEREQQEKGYDDEWLLNEYQKILATLDKGSDLYLEYYDKWLKLRNDIQNDDIKEWEESSKKTAESIKKAYEDVNKAQEQAEKDYLKSGTALGKSVTEKGGKDRFVLNDLTEESKALEKYRKSMDELKATGISDDLLAGVMQFDYKDGSRQQFIDELLGMSEKQREQYYKDYAAYMAEVEKTGAYDVQDKLDEANQLAAQGVSDIYANMPDEAYQKGKETADSYLQGIIDSMSDYDSIISGSFFNSINGKNLSAAVDNTSSAAGGDVVINFVVDGETITTKVVSNIAQEIRRGGNPLNA